MCRCNETWWEKSVEIEQPEGVERERTERKGKIEKSGESELLYIIS